MPWFTRKWILIIRYLHFDAVALGGLSAEDKGRSCGKGRLGSLWGRKSNHYWSVSWPVVVRTPTSSGNYSWPVLLRFVTSTGSFYVRRCYLPPMTAGCSINSCNSVLYVFLFFSPRCVLRAHQKAVRPASSLGMGLGGAYRNMWADVPYFFGVKMVISPVESFLQVSLCLDASRV